MKMNFEKLHAQKIKWMSHGQNAFCYGFLYVNDNKKFGYNNLKMMHYLSYYKNSINASNPRTQTRKF